MEMNVLAIGDVVGEPGLQHLGRHLHRLRRDTRADFVVVNGENASGVGLTPAQASKISSAWAGVSPTPLAFSPFTTTKSAPVSRRSRWR